MNSCGLEQIRKNVLYQNTQEKKKKKNCQLNAVLFINVKNRCFAVYGQIRLKTSCPITEVTSIPVSTWMGDRLGIPGAVDFYPFLKL